MNTANSLKATSLEKRTFTLHLISQFFNGLTLGSFLLQDIILKKSLGGSDYQVMVLSLLVSSAFLVSIYGSELVNRSRCRSKTILILGVSAKFFLIIIPIFENKTFYIACIAIAAYLDSMLLPVWNIVFKHNYSEANRSKLYSYAATLQTILILIVTTVFGYYLDMDNSSYKIVFPAAGLCGILVYYCLARMIKLAGDGHNSQGDRRKLNISLKLIKDIIALPYRSTIRIFKINPAFMRFEIYFFMYGMAFMILSPVIPVFLVDGLKLAYTPISLAKGLIFHSALILFTPLMGRFHGSRNVNAFCGFAFSILAIFPLLLVSSEYFSGITGIEMMVYISFFVFGFAMSGVTLAWALSSIHYAPHNEVGNYQAVHVTLTGVRGVFSPALGYIVMITLGIEYSFYAASFLFLLGGIMMFREGRKA